MALRERFSCSSYGGWATRVLLAVGGKDMEERPSIIQLPHGIFALIDSEDYERISKHRWSCIKNGAGNPRAVKRAEYIKEGRTTKTFYLHRELMNPPSEMCVDHIDGDPLNNQKNNLRVCSHSENAANIQRDPRSKSGFFGVYWHKGKEKWKACIMRDYKSIHIGYFITAEQAAIERDIVAVELFGEFATLNFPDRYGRCSDGIR